MIDKESFEKEEWNFFMVFTSREKNVILLPIPVFLNSFLWFTTDYMSFLLVKLISSFRLLERFDLRFFYPCVRQFSLSLSGRSSQKLFNFG